VKILAAFRDSKYLVIGLMGICFSVFHPATLLAQSNNPFCSDDGSVEPPPPPPDPQEDCGPNPICVGAVCNFDTLQWNTAACNCGGQIPPPCVEGVLTCLAQTSNTWDCTVPPNPCPTFGLLCRGAKINYSNCTVDRSGCCKPDGNVCCNPSGGGGGGGGGDDDDDDDDDDGL
jgi:hypothetical protein